MGRGRERVERCQFISSGQSRHRLHAWPCHLACDHDCHRRAGFRNGRTFCNTVCPVGTTLSFISRYSIFRIDINTDKCVQCRRCEHVCKASCIDMTSHVVDTSRCVVCFDCLSDCPNDAIHYTYNRHQLSIPLMQRVKDTVAGQAAGMSDTAVRIDTGKESSGKKMSSTTRLLDRRRFLSAGVIVAAVPVVARAAKLTDSIDRAAQPRRNRSLLAVTPPGTLARREFLDRCTGCGLCVDRCPQKVLKVSLDEYSLLRALHPVMDYDTSWCVYDCTICSNLCPTGALHPLTVSEKHRSPVGLAYTDRDMYLILAGCELRSMFAPLSHRRYNHDRARRGRPGAVSDRRHSQVHRLRCLPVCLSGREQGNPCRRHGIAPPHAAVSKF